MEDRNSIRSKHEEELREQLNVISSIGISGFGVVPLIRQRNEREEREKLRD